MKKIRAEALAAGDQYYDTGKPCKYGHLSKRATVDGACCECRRENLRRERALFRALRAAIRKEAQG